MQKDKHVIIDVLTDDARKKGKTERGSHRESVAQNIRN